MALELQEIEVIESTWKQVEGLGAEAKALFSFRDEPDMFNSPKLKAHGSNVVKHVGVAVANIRDLGKVVPTLQDLGKRHVKYGVVEEHYGVVGQALIKTLGMGLGEAFTEEVKAAWEKVYGIVQTTMLSGTKDA